MELDVGTLIKKLVTFFPEFVLHGDQLRPPSPLPQLLNSLITTQIKQIKWMWLEKWSFRLIRGVQCLILYCKHGDVRNVVLSSSLAHTILFITKEMFMLWIRMVR